MGFAEVVRHVPRVLRRIDDIVAAVRRLAPAAVVTIDAQALSLRVVRRLAGAGIRSSSTSRRRSGRGSRPRGEAGALSRPYHHPAAVRAAVLRAPRPGGDVCRLPGGRGRDRRRRRRVPRAPWHCGRRAVAVRHARQPARRDARLFPVFRETARLLAARVPGLHVVIPVVANVADLVEQASRGFPAPLTLSRDTAERRDVFAAVDAALVKSGTTSVELAVAGVPVVVTHKVSVLSAAIFIMVRRVRLVSIVNIMAGRMVQPELLQANCRPRRLAKAVAHLLQDGIGPARATRRRRRGRSAARPGRHGAQRTGGPGRARSHRKPGDTGGRLGPARFCRGLPPRESNRKTTSWRRHKRDGNERANRPGGSLGYKIQCTDPDK